MEGFSFVLSMLGMLVVMVAIFAGAYYVTRFVGKNYVQPGALSGKIRILDQTMTGKEERLLLVRVADKVYLIASGPNGASKIDELDPAMFPEQPPQASPADSGFWKVLSDTIRKQHDTGGNT